MRRMCVVVLLVLGLACSARAADRLDAAVVQKTVEDSFPAFLEVHKTVTEFESPTGDVEGSKRITAWLKDQLEPLGYSFEFRPNEKGTHTIANIKGDGALRILILGHTDTVQPVGSLEKQPYHYDESTGLVKGPGAGDSKASVAQVVMFARLLNDLGFTNFAELTIYWDAEEETGSATEDEILAELAQKHDLTLSVDSSPPNWGMNTQRKWVVNYELNVEGQTGHAGNSAQSSASATVELANQIVRIMQLASPLPDNPADYTPEALEQRGIVDYGQFIPPVTINVGVVSTTNTKVNAIPNRAYAKFDIRGFKEAEREYVDAEIRRIAASPTVVGTTVTVVGPSNYMPAMEKTPEAGKLAEIYKELAKDLYNADVTEWATGGVSIGNFTSRYIPTIDGLGVETYSQHDLENERADAKTYVPRTVIMILLLDRVSNENIL